jgi:hypothetical protein
MGVPTTRDARHHRDVAAVALRRYADDVTRVAALKFGPGQVAVIFCEQNTRTRRARLARSRMRFVLWSAPARMRGIRRGS